MFFNVLVVWFKILLISSAWSKIVITKNALLILKLTFCFLLTVRFFEQIYFYCTFYSFVMMILTFVNYMERFWGSYKLEKGN